MTVSEQIFEWIEKNKDFFKASVICKKVGIDKGNFSKYKNAKVIPERHIHSIIEIIEPLGFCIKGNLLQKIISKRQKDDVIQENNNEKIKKQISDIQNERIPAERNTPLGKKIWSIEQQNKISELQKLLK